MKKVIQMDVDVLVLGAGPAGFASAVSAARNGAQVLLVEKAGFVGGTAVSGLCLHTFHNMHKEKVVSGFPEEIIENLKKLNGSIGPVEIKNAHMKTTTPVDAEILKYLMLKLIDENGVKLLLHSFASDVVIKDDEIVEVVVETKSDRRLIRAKVFIDATGDGDIAAWAGAEYKKGRDEDGLMQAMSLVYKMVGVDHEKMLSEIGIGKAYAEKSGEGEICMWFSADLDKFADKVEEEKLFPFKKHVFWGNSFYRGDVNLNITRIINFDPTDADGLTRAEVEGRVQAYKTSEFLKKYVSGFENAHIAATSSAIGIRETRRILGEYVLTEEDVLKGQKFEDAIARCAYPVDIHDPKGTGTFFTQVENDYYEIPYRCLLPKKFKNLIVVGRCISTTYVALASVRTMITVMSIGQAAGIAAAMSSLEGISPKSINAKDIQLKLRDQGAMI